MCCYYSEENTKAFKKKMKSKVNRHGYVSLWKVFQIVNGRMTGPYQYYPSCHTYTSGVNKSNRISRRINPTDDNGKFAIYRGIHVYTSITKAKSTRDNGYRFHPFVYIGEKSYNAKYVIMKVWVKLSDLVGCGKHEDAVFMSVYIPPRNYYRAMKGK